MIHHIYVDGESELAALQKEARRRLMTGGAVFEIARDLSSEDFFRLYSRFSPYAKNNNIACSVLAELAKHQNLPIEMTRMLSVHTEAAIQRVLVNRSFA